MFAGIFDFDFENILSRFLASFVSLRRGEEGGKCAFLRLIHIESINSIVLKTNKTRQASNANSRANYDVIPCTCQKIRHCGTTILDFQIRKTPEMIRKNSENNSLIQNRTETEGKMGSGAVP